MIEIDTTKNKTAQIEDLFDISIKDGDNTLEMVDCDLITYNSTLGEKPNATSYFEAN